MAILLTGTLAPSGGAGAFPIVNADDIQFDPGAEVTLDANGDFTQPTSFHFPVDTYADAANDNIRNITRDANAPALIIIRPAADTRTIVVEHDAAGGNVSCVGGADITLDDQEDFCFLLYDSTATRWYAMSGTGGGGTMKVSKSIVFSSPNADLAVEDWLSDQATRVPAAGKHGTWTPGTIYVRVGTAGTGTNTILFRTSSTLTGVRTTRATVNLGTAREASAAITWTPADGEYMWVECSAVGGTPPKKGIAQVDIEEAIYS